MNVSPDALVAHLDGEVVLLHAVTKNYFRLNETGQLVWRQIEKGCDLEGVVEAVVAAYDVSAATAHAEVARMVDELRAAGLVR